MFSETRYALNGDLRVAYRASGEGPRDLVFVFNPFTNCEVFLELPSIQGWFEAMTSLGRLVFFDLPGTGASDPVTPGALPTLEQWADSITAVLDDLGSREAVVVAVDGAVATGAMFAATYPSRTTALVVLEGYAEPFAERPNAPRPRCAPSSTKLRSVIVSGRVRERIQPSGLAQGVQRVQRIMGGQNVILHA